MTTGETSLVVFLRNLSDTLETLETRPYGPEAGEAESHVAGNFILGVCQDRDKALAAWRQLEEGFGGYMPWAAARALCIAASSKDIILPDSGPEVE